MVNSRLTTGKGGPTFNFIVIPAKAGIQLLQSPKKRNKLDPRFRGGDGK
jgi:hypothetical protein